MNLDAKGRTVYEADLKLEPVKLAELEAAIGTPSAADTASLVPFFGATIGGDSRLVEALDMDLSRSLLTGHRYEWKRPFEPGETVHAVLTIEDVYEKGSGHLAVLVAEFRNLSGEVIQRQQTTFLERTA